MFNLVLQWMHSPPPSGKHARVKKPPVLVRVPRDLHAVDVRLRQPPLSKTFSLVVPIETLTKDVVQLGTTPRIVAVFTSGRNNIRAATLRLSAPSGIQFHYQDATLVSDRASLACNSESVTLSDVQPNSTVLVHIPHSDASAFHAMVRSFRPP